MEKTELSYEEFLVEYAKSKHYGGILAVLKVENEWTFETFTGPDAATLRHWPESIRWKIDLSKSEIDMSQEAFEAILVLAGYHEVANV